MLFTIVPLMMALGGTARTNGSTMGRDILRRVFLHPFILATFAGLLVSVIGLGMPGPVNGILVFLSSAAAPVALFAVGASLAQKQVGKVTVEMPVLLLIKLVRPPADRLPAPHAGSAVSIRTWLYAAVLMAALPPAANVLALRPEIRKSLPRPVGHRDPARYRRVGGHLLTAAASSSLHGRLRSIPSTRRGTAAGRRRRRPAA